MRGPNLALLAWRNLWRNRRRTLLTLISLTFGLFLAVLFTSMQDRSFADMIDMAARMGGGHVTIQHPEYLDSPSLSRTVTGGERLINTAEDAPHAYKAVARINGQAMVATAGQNYGALVMAYDPAVEDDETLSFLEGIQTGEMLTAGDKRGAVLGVRLARNLGVELGDKVVYTMMDKQGEIVGGLARVRGTLSTGADSVDGALMLVPLDSLRETLGYAPDESTQIAVFLGDARKSDDTVAAIQPELGGGASALPWYTINAELAGFIAMKVGGARFFELVILVLVAASVFNTLLVSVMERIREFGIMMAIGYSPGQLFRLVMWESLWLALLGVLLGCTITWWPYNYLAKNGIDLTAVYATQDALEVAGVGFDPMLHVGIFPENFAIIVITLLLSTLAAGLYPAWWAGRVEPVESIKLV